MTLQLLIAATQGCPTDQPFVIEITPCTDMLQNDSMTTQDPETTGTNALNCVIQVLDDLPSTETNELLVFAENVSNPEAAMIQLAVETLETEVEEALVSICPDVKWSCILVAVRIDLRIPFGIQSNFANFFA